MLRNVYSSLSTAQRLAGRRIQLKIPLFGDILLEVLRFFNNRAKLSQGQACELNSFQSPHDITRLSSGFKRLLLVASCPCYQYSVHRLSRIINGRATSPLRIEYQYALSNAYPLNCETSVGGYSVPKVTSLSFKTRNSVLLPP